MTPGGGRREGVICALVEPIPCPHGSAQPPVAHPCHEPGNASLWAETFAGMSPKDSSG